MRSSVKAVMMRLSSLPLLHPFRGHDQARPSVERPGLSLRGNRTLWGVQRGEAPLRSYQSSNPPQADASGGVGAQGVDYTAWQHALSPVVLFFR